MRFADEEHLRRYVRKGVRAMKEQLDIALGYLEDGHLGEAANFLDSVEGEAAALWGACLDWPDNRAPEEQQDAS